MKHPNESQLALFAGGDLGFWDRSRVRQHVSRCSICESEVQSLRAAAKQIRDLAGEMPGNLNLDRNWDRLAEEMTGNIRVGLAAGEAIARFDRPAASAKPMRLGWSAGFVIAGATAVFVAAFWINVPQPQKDHLATALAKIRTERLGKLVTSQPATADEMVLEASASGIELTEHGRTLSLMHPTVDQRRVPVTVSVNMHGSAGVRYVDADTGQVTTNKVYYAEQ
jgi:hypothetical protein